jgi:hypothetical protein
MTTEDYIWLAAQAFAFWCTGFGAGTLHRVFQQLVEKASSGD